MVHAQSCTAAANAFKAESCSGERWHARQVRAVSALRQDASLHRARACQNAFRMGPSEALREAMGGRAELYVHRGAHLVPTCSGDFKRVVLAFLTRHGSGQRASGSAGGPAAEEAAAAAGGS